MVGLGTRRRRGLAPRPSLPLLLIAGWIALASAAPGAAYAQMPALPDRVRALVTGEPASPAYITMQIGTAVERAAAAAIGAGGNVQVRAIAPAPQNLDRGFATSFSVQFTLVPAAGAMPQDGAMTVDVDNVDVSGFDPPTLSFRDDPEKIVADGVLSRTMVEASRPARIYYYHQNTGVARRFSVVLSANGSVRTRVHVVRAEAGPNIDVMSVGHAVTRTFLARKPHDEGTVVEIAGGKPAIERSDVVGAGEGIVGSIDLRVLYGGPVTLTVMAIPEAADPRAFLYTPKLPDDGHGRHGSFDLAGFGQRIVAYTIGGPDAAFVYGSRRQTPANLDPADRGNDFGDYGVLERITFDLANPSAEPVTAYLYEKPLGGVVRSSFLVNGALTELGCVRVARRYAVSSVALAPRTTAALDVVTMTDGGSNYPLEIGVTATPPETATPPLRAPDGCFPAKRSDPSPTL